MISFTSETKTFLEKRQLMLVGDITGQLQEKITSGILYLNTLNDEPIELLIDSCGGGVDAGLLICDAIKNSKASVRGIVTGFAHSMAFFILQACDKRLAYKHAKLMIHGFSSESFRIDDKNLMEKIEKCRKLLGGVLKEVSKKSGQKIKKIRKMSAIEKCFTADEARKLNFLDKVL